MKTCIEFNLPLGRFVLYLFPEPVSSEIASVTFKATKVDKKAVK